MVSPGATQDWRRDGARNDDLAGAESLARVGKQRGNVTNDVHQFTGRRFKIGSVCRIADHSERSARASPRASRRLHARGCSRLDQVALIDVADQRAFHVF